MRNQTQSKIVNWSSLRIEISNVNIVKNLTLIIPTPAAVIFKGLLKYHRFVSLKQAHPVYHESRSVKRKGSRTISSFLKSNYAVLFVRSRAATFQAYIPK